MDKLKRILIIFILMIVGFFVVYGTINLFQKKSIKDLKASPSSQTNPSPEKTLALVYSFYNDKDNDGLSDAKEIIYGTDLKKSDTDGDSYLDGDEVKNGYDPTVPGPARLETRQSQNLTIQYFSWVQEKYNIEDPILKKSSINEYLNLNFPKALNLPTISTEDLIITYNESTETLQEYITNVNNIELPQSFTNYPDLYEKMLIGEMVDIDGILKELTESTNKLHNMRVPTKAIDIHKQYIGIMETLKIIFADLKIAQKDPILIELNIRKGQELAILAGDLKDKKAELLK